MITVTTDPMTIEKRHATMGGELGATFVWCIASGELICTFVPQGATPHEIRRAAQDLLLAADRWSDNTSGGT